MVYERNYQHLDELLKDHLPAETREEVHRAYKVAERAHLGQLRDEGTPYIVHPVRVAVSLVEELQIYRPQLVCAALLHDVIEDSNTSRKDIESGFGEEVAEIVWLLTKFEDTSLSDYLSAIEAAAETGAPIVKLCDRLDNLRFLAHSPRDDKRRRYVRTTESYYLPLASRTNRYLHDEILHWLDEARKHL
jgi:GTP pyrophosphokinase/guanosine-3',5'-bis(diphosphate) 3'-pyrophosphohydrolase